MNDEEMDNIQSRIDELTSELENMGKKKMMQARMKGRHYAQMLREKGQETLEKAKSTGRNVDYFAHEKPWAMVGIAAGMGMIVGLIVGMGSAKKRHCGCE